MMPMYQISIPTDHGDKEISVYCCNILDFDQPVDVLTTSAFRYSYKPTPGTLFGALDQAGISVEQLAQKPPFDLRKSCNIWLSELVRNNPFLFSEYLSNSRFSGLQVGRIGCIEARSTAVTSYTYPVEEQELLNSIRAYFRMLEIAAVYNISVDTVALPLLGAGRQNISSNLTVYPLINECLEFLKRCRKARRILFIEYAYANARLLADTLERVCGQEQAARSCRELPPRQASQSAAPQFFISYNCADRAAADTLYQILHQRGIPAWYAPYDSCDTYSAEIYNSIQTASHFVVLLSSNSKSSHHVLNEVALAFQQLSRGIRIKPIELDYSPPEASFEYYLASQHRYFAYTATNAEFSAIVDQILRHL